MLQRRSMLALHRLFSSPCQLCCVLCLQEYAYTMAAAYRSEQRRLLSLLRMADFMMCDTLQTVLVQSVSEMLAAMEPSAYTAAPAEQQALDAGRGASGSGATSAFSSSSGGRSLQAMATMVNSSRRQRASLAVAGMQQKPVTATRQAAAAEAAAAAAAAVDGADQTAAGERQPLLELDVVMSSSCDELSFVPEPDQFQV
jgi:dynein heavy chain